MPILKKRKIDQDVYTLAKQRIHNIYDKFDHVAVSFSGGKDSTAVLNVAAEVAAERGKLPLRVIFFDEEVIPYEVERYMRRVAARPDIALEWYCVPIKHNNSCDPDYPHWYTWAEEDRDLWVRDMPPEGIRTIKGYDSDKVENRVSIPELAGLLYPPELGRCCQLLGIRGDESITRYRSVARREADNYIQKHESGFSNSGPVKTYGNFWKASPVYDWAVRDIWTAVGKFNWDYCECYDVWEMMGIPHNSQRLAPPYGTEPARGLWTFQHCFPDVWDRMSQRVPGANTAALYGHTDLFGVGKIEKPDDMTWQEFISHHMERYNAKERDILARRLKSEIGLHFKKTTDPILDLIAHPKSGVSWEYLAKLVVRGDFKERNQPQFSGGVGYGRYNEALRQGEYE